MKLDAILVGYENQENLGIRYVMSYLESAGFRVGLVECNPANPSLLIRSIREGSPVLVGFSIIFQYSLRDFGGLMAAVRAAGVTAHFTCGGHFPSLCPERTLAELPELDSVVRFEGERTAAELLSCLTSHADHSTIEGLACRQGQSVLINPPRPLVEDLDTLPWPHRGELRQVCRGGGVAPVLASRGCLYNCSFCSIHNFYAGAPGPARRVRSPKDVVAEMRHLFDTRGVRFFLFQDDDFAFRSRLQRNWISSYLDELDAAELSSRIGWKISCRVDDVEPELMSRCRDRGLLTVYLGIESGSERGLQTLNKRASVADNLAAVDTLSRIGVEFDTGFMLFEPDSTFETVAENIEFLRELARRGGPPVSFVKMLPLAGTAIQKRLAAEGRLSEDDVRPDYDLLDPRLDWYALWVTLAFSFRNSDPNGLVERLRQAWFDAIALRVLGREPACEGYASALRNLIDRANQSALDCLAQGLELTSRCSSKEEVALQWSYLNRLAVCEREDEEQISEALVEVLRIYNPELAAEFSVLQPSFA